MSVLSLIIGILIATLFGWVIIRLLKTDSPFLERLAIAYTFGLGGITLLMFYSNILGIPFSVGATLFIPLLSVVYLLIREKEKIVCFSEKPKEKIRNVFNLTASYWRRCSLLEKILFAAIVFLFLTALARALYWPVFYWDAMTAYDARAQFFIKDRLITVVAQKVSWEFHNYPPFTSLVHTYFYLLGARNPKIFYTLIYLSFLITFYYSLRVHTSRVLGLALTLLLAANPFVLEHAAASYTNLSYTFFLGMGTIYLIRFFEEKRFSLFWVGTLLFALSTWTRPSPEWFFGAALLVIIIYTIIKKQRFWLPILFALPVMLVWLPWPLFLKFVIGQEHLRVAAGTRSLLENVFLGSFQGRIDGQKFLEMIRLLVSTIKNSLNYVLYLFLTVLVFDLLDKRKLKRVGYPLLFLGIYGGQMFLGVYNSLFTWHDWHNLIVNSINRFVMIFLPLMIYYVGLSFAKNHE